jgi:hypothetical protein
MLKERALGALAHEQHPLLHAVPEVLIVMTDAGWHNSRHGILLFRSLSISFDVLLRRASIGGSLDP